MKLYKPWTLPEPSYTALLCHWHPALVMFRSLAASRETCSWYRIKRVLTILLISVSTWCSFLLLFFPSYSVEKVRLMQNRSAASSPLFLVLWALPWTICINMWKTAGLLEQIPSIVLLFGAEKALSTAPVLLFYSRNKIARVKLLGLHIMWWVLI